MTRDSAVWGADQKLNSGFLLTSEAEAPLAEAGFVFSALSFPSGKGRSISYCLCYRGRMALLFSVPGLPRQCTGAKMGDDCWWTLGSKSLPTARQGPGASLTPGYPLQQMELRQPPPEVNHPGKLLPCAGKLSRSWKAKQSPILFEALKMMSLPQGCHLWPFRWGRSPVLFLHDNYSN